MAKYYAVKAGKKTGIFRSWPETQEQVKGFSNAKYKSFATEAEALAYMGDSDSRKVATAGTGYEAYVDGSFNKGLQQYGSGVVVLKDGKEVERISIPGKDSRFIESFQIAGEVIAALEAVKWAEKNAVSDISIYYDYQGIASWALGEWRANKNISKFYVAEYAKLKTKVNVTFVKVKGHSGDTYNDVADSLAGAAANSMING